MSKYSLGKNPNSRNGFKKGHKVPKEWKEKISLANKGHIAWNKGLKGFRTGIPRTLGKHWKLTEETKEKMRLAFKGRKKANNGWIFPKGYKPWNYIDGRSKLLAPARYGDDWDKIRYLVYLRDRFTCQNCGIKGIRLDIHHKIPFLISRNNSLSNLITLCRSCHMKKEKLNLKIENIKTI